MKQNLYSLSRSIGSAVVLFILFSHMAVAQIYDPDTWSAHIENETDNEATLVLTVSLEPGWHIYSQDLPDDGGPIPTRFDFETDANQVSIEGETIEPEAHEEYDKQFDMVLKYFENTVSFKQKIRKLSPDRIQIKATATFMLCDDRRCLPPDEYTHTFVLNADKAPVASSTNTPAVTSAYSPTPSSTSEEESSLMGIFILCFLGGFVALLTPCVFPMIPMTVSVFTKQQGSGEDKKPSGGFSKALLFGLSIVVIYVILGFGITAIFGASALNALSTDVYFNLFFFLLLVVFAISFFGGFEIMLPSKWLQFANVKSSQGSGFIAVFFMAFTLALVSFSCTGPIIGTLLVQAAVHGGIAGPLVGMFGFSLALAVPFALFAAFPSWMNTLPKSGGWLNSVKVVLGFLELAFALKFFSNADLVMQWHLLERELFIALWVVIFGLMGFYLLGKIRLPHDSPIDKLSVPRFMLAVVTLSFTLYLLPGVWGAPVKLISGFPPPQNYSETFGQMGGFLSKSNAPSASHGDADVHFELGPHGIPTLHDYYEALEYSKKINKPLFIDFTGHACVNCRKVEDLVWSDPRVTDILTNDVIVVSLYVDDKRDLPEDEVYTSPHSGKEINTIGKKWSELQTYSYGTNSQPYYIIQDGDENRYSKPIAYETDIEAYIAWLKQGIANFKAKKVIQ